MESETRDFNWDEMQNIAAMENQSIFCPAGWAEADDCGGDCDCNNC